MAAVRCAARRLGGSLLQRTQAAVTSPAVAEERRRLFSPRQVHTRRNPPETLEEAELEIKKKKEVLFDVISKTEKLGFTDSTNRKLLKSLSAQVEPRPDDPQWRKMRAWRRLGDAMGSVGRYVSYSLSVVVVLEVHSRNVARKKLARHAEGEVALA